VKFQKFHQLCRKVDVIVRSLSTSLLLWADHYVLYSVPLVCKDFAGKFTCYGVRTSCRVQQCTPARDYCRGGIV